MFVDFNRGAADVYGERSDVSRRAPADGRRDHRAASAAAARAGRAREELHRARADASSTSGRRSTDPGYDVVTENRYFVAGADVEWEELSFSVNGSKWGADRPPFPLLQPEKVLSLPLQLRFDEGYRYRLAGTERVDGYRLLRRALRAGARTTARSIAARSGSTSKTFARIRVQAVQGGLPAPVVSNEEIQHYTPPVAIGNQPVFLFSGLTARQIVLIAGRNLLVEKRCAFTDFRVNDAGLRARARRRRARATASCSAKPIAACATTSRRAARASSATAPTQSAPRRWRWA